MAQKFLALLYERRKRLVDLVPVEFDDLAQRAGDCAVRVQAGYVDRYRCCDGAARGQRYRDYEPDPFRHWPLVFGDSGSFALHWDVSMWAGSADGVGRRVMDRGLEVLG